MNKTRYSATEFGGNKPMNFRLSGTLRGGYILDIILIYKVTLHNSSIHLIIEETLSCEKYIL